LQIFTIIFNDGSVHDCNEILNQKRNVLSWMNSAKGKIFVFKKIKEGEHLRYGSASADCSQTHCNWGTVLFVLESNLSAKECAFPAVTD
jgi:hypothetical protein